MIAEGKAANALGGKTARACDSCLKKRARWFCAADDAFLCQACDTFVHSANQLASRHERVRLETASSFRVSDLAKFVVDDEENNVVGPPTWFTRKARTPRGYTKPPAKVAAAEANNSHPLVPEMSGDDELASPDDESEEQILCRVPVFNDEPFSSSAAELNDDDQQQLSLLFDDDHHDLEIPDFIASDAELAEFAADVESLLGINEEFDDGLEGKVAEEGNLNINLNQLDVCFEEDQRRLVKVEDDDDQDGAEVQAVIACHFDPALDMARESLCWDFQYSSSPLPGEEEEEEEEEFKVLKANDQMAPILMKEDNNESKEQRRMKLLKLNYETVITAWASQGSPWADGRKPEFIPDDCWPDFMDISPRELHHQPFGDGGRRIGGRDEEREARVLRYREKRRTRLFSKKIRYEVRKLNAEKRPRMKGRFVKRTSFAGPPSSTFPSYLMNKNK
ncbi:OLC1v1014209C1 [Oldenlandia corymbosa var. corymbosa]|uniref:OLC1v1014209C1 n=1 Tax=Oldenlandia corymbosa var. corymbosa TaxID=529605 RepID=A0AAV1E2A9_OLDCO|nr:OLC1v1014209C1 [Oldenlandia corymbosa var. corymbosa]